jgi:hypothetical protein
LRSNKQRRGSGLHDPEGFSEEPRLPGMKETLINTNTGMFDSMINIKTGLEDTLTNTNTGIKQISSNTNTGIEET